MSSKADSEQAVAALQETSQKVTAALLPAIDAHVKEFSRKDGLDFLDVKNNLVLSYLIELNVFIRNRNNGKKNEKNLHRLTEMKTVLDKMRGLDKKLRYQIEKLLAANSSATAFAAGGDNNGPEDPLQFRPDLGAMGEDDDGDDGSVLGEGSDDDDDLAAARATLSMNKGKKNRVEDENGGIYRAPRLTAVPYAHDLEQKEKEKEKRAKHRLRASELAQTLRAQYGDVPEQEDVHGGGDYGKQRAAARRWAEHEAEKTKYEESAMIRLSTTRKEKKARKRLMQQESSNLSAIANLGNLVRETQAFGGRDNESDNEPVPEPSSQKQRYVNGKRRREPENIDARPMRRGGKAGKSKAKNSFQAALYNTGG